MFTSNRPLRKFFSGAFAALLLASIVAAQDIPSGARGAPDATALPILNLSPLARAAPEKTSVAQDSLFDFTLPRMKPVGLISSSNRGESSMAQAGAGPAQGPLRITLEEALARAVSTHAVVLTAAGADAAHFHHKALQSDYFPKVGAYLVNIHYNKFMGDTIQLFRRGIIFPTVTRAVPLFDKDQTFVGPTVTQPLTPLFKVHEAVRIAKADERIAQAKANAASVQLTADVERTYFDLLIAQRRQAEAMANVEIAERKLQIASAAAAPVDGVAHRLAKLEYVPDAVITGGYMFQTGIPALPDDFSWIGVIATWTIFDFFKRERTIKERGAQVTMAKANLEMVRAKVAAGGLKTVMDVDRTRRVLELTRRVASMQRAMAPRDQDPGPEARAALAGAEAEMFQAGLDYRMAYAQMKRAEGEQ